MSRHPDHKPKSIADDRERLELVFKRVLGDDSEIWTPEERKRNLERLNLLIADYRAKCIELGIAGGKTLKKRPTANGKAQNGRAALRRSA